MPLEMDMAAQNRPLVPEIGQQDASGLHERLQVFPYSSNRVFARYREMAKCRSYSERNPSEPLYGRHSGAILRKIADAARPQGGALAVSLAGPNLKKSIGAGDSNEEEQEFEVETHEAYKSRRL